MNGHFWWPLTEPERVQTVPAPQKLRAPKMNDESYIKEDLIELRKELGLTQHQMADELGMALRAYQSIEAGESEYRRIHRLAAERVALQIAADKKAPTLAPIPLREDAIELVRVGRLSGNPAFLKDKRQDARSEKIEDIHPDEKFRASYAVVGELVLITSALDFQLNHVLIETLHLGNSVMIEPVIATLDMVRKIEMLKERSKHIAQTDWKKALLSYLDKLERISKWRNIAAHTTLIPDEKHGAVFIPTQAAKLLKNLQIGEQQPAKRIPISDFKPQIKLGEEALGEGQVLVENFQKVNVERVKRHGK